MRGDQKDFAAGDWKFGISVLEVGIPLPPCGLRRLRVAPIGICAGANSVRAHTAHDSSGQVTDIAPVVAKAREIMLELRLLKKEKGGGALGVRH